MTSGSPAAPPPEVEARNEPDDDPTPTERVQASLRRKGLLPRPKPLRALVKLAESLPTRGNDLDLFFTGEPLFDRMVEDIQGATTRIAMEIYTFRSDSTGRRIAKALCAAARRGVEVRVIFDAVGCFGTPSSFFGILAESGVLLLEYHPIAPWRKRFALLERNHRKTLIVDGRIGYTGGFNIGNDWLDPPEGAGWRDTHARVDGPAAGDLEALFVDSWYRQSGEHLRLERLIPREPDVADDDPHRHRQIYVIGRRGGALDRPLRKLYLLALGRARRSVTITSAYLVPDPKMRRALRAAARRGLDVRLLLPGRSDVGLVHWASRHFFDRFLRWGVDIYLWAPTVLHAKTAVVDERWCTIGSANLDSLSFNWNLEANFVVECAHTGRALEEQFRLDLDQSDRVVDDEWRKRPRLDRLREWLAALLAPIL
ncbi:MAG: hypothetical protein KDC38_11690 [Planctomycetes bacterium]|nr:hypothetical protein [Planctomycetota bacterium]